MPRLRAFLAALALAVASALLTPTDARADTDHLNQFFASYHADVGSSVDLGDGRILWLFGDTIRPHGDWHRNSAVIQEPGGAFTQLPGTFVPASAPGHWYWPGQAVREGDQLHVLAMDFTCDAPCGAWSYRYQHTDILTYQLPALTLTARTPAPPHPLGAMWSQLHQATDGYTYVYGSYAVPGELGKAVAVARATTGALADPVAWEHLNAQMGPELELGTVSSVVGTATGGYRLYSKRLDLWTEDIIAYDAPTPYGPWTGRTTVATAPQTSGTWTYAVEAHPEQPPDNPGELILTYATNCDRLCAEYRVTALGVPAP